MPRPGNRHGATNTATDTLPGRPTDSLRRAPTVNHIPRQRDVHDVNATDHIIDLRSPEDRRLSELAAQRRRVAERLREEMQATGELGTILDVTL